jgi:hypothetical protein
MYEKIVERKEICPEMFRIMKEIGNPIEKLKKVIIGICSFINLLLS